MAGFELARSRPLVGLPKQEEPDQGVRRGRGVHPTFGFGTAALWGRLAARQPAGRVALGPAWLKKEGKL